jgi:transcriptional regulator with XRE-family HTH domain
LLGFSLVVPRRHEVSKAGGHELADAVDEHLGRRLYRRRRLLGLTQNDLALVIGVRFQQIQKYESAANKMSASRLWRLAQVLDVPVAYFFEGLSGKPETDGHETSGPDLIDPT